MRRLNDEIGVRFRVGTARAEAGLRGQGRAGPTWATFLSALLRALALVAA